MANTQEPMVVFENVNKTYDGENLVIKNLNLSVQRGEFLTMLGPSGSGKTTVLMMLAGFEVSTSGVIRIDGVDATKIPSHKRNLGFVFQNYALFPHMTVGENLAFPLKVRKRSKSDIEKRVLDTLAMVRLRDFVDRLPGQLSGGQQQRIALARALVFEPTLVLMDEPLGALDKNLREEMQYEIKRLHDSLDATMIYVTHDQTEALVMSDRVAIFDGGLIQQVASPVDVYDRPSTSFVASFIGESNAFYGVVDSLDGEKCKVTCESGDTIFANKTDKVEKGSKTMVSLRPELVYLLDGKKDKSDRYDNMVDAKVKELIFLGDHIRARLSVFGNEEFVAKLVHGGEQAQVVVGDTVRIGWRSQDSWALDEGVR